MSNELIAFADRRAEGVASRNGAGPTSGLAHPTRPATRENAYDPRRLRRSFALKWERLGVGEYRIWGGAKEHFVKLDRDPPCDCEDWYFGGGTRRCKHLLRATVVETLILNGDGALLQAMEAMLERDEAIQKEHRRATTQKGRR